MAAIAAAGGRAVAALCDITDYTAVTQAVAGFEAHTARDTDILVNNAGWDTPMPFLKTDAAFWHKVTAINWFGPLHMTHAVAQGMAQRKAGRIINIASDAGRVGASGEVAYSGCKGATIAFAKALAMVRGVPMGRIGQPDDYPGLVAFLASDDAAFMTGQTISVAGGLSMHG